MRARLALGLLFVTSPALADELTETRGGALHDRVDPEVEIEPAKLHVGWRLDATFASRSTASGGEADFEGLASVGGELAVSHEDCDIFTIGGQLDATSGTESPVSAQQWASLCPIAGQITIRLDHLLQWDVEPTLLARPRLRPEASRRETFSVFMGGRSERINDPGPLTLLPIPPAEYLTFIDSTMTVSIGWTADPYGPSDATVGAGSSFFVYHREREDDVPLQVDILGMHMIGSMPADDGDRDPSDDGMSMLARLDGVRWQNAYWRGFRIGGGLSAGFVSAGVGVMEPHRDTFRIVTEPSLSIERDLDDELTVSAAVERTHWALWDGMAVIDDRATVGFSRRAGRVRLRADTFVAKTYVLDSDERITRAVTGGITAVAETDLGDHAVMRLRTDLGRGFYAQGATFESPRVAGELLATIDVHAGNR